MLPVCIYMWLSISVALTLCFNCQLLKDGLFTIQPSVHKSSALSWWHLKFCFTFLATAFKFQTCWSWRGSTLACHSQNQHMPFELCKRRHASTIADVFIFFAAYFNLNINKYACLMVFQRLLVSLWSVSYRMLWWIFGSFALTQMAYFKMLNCLKPWLKVNQADKRNLDANSKLNFSGPASQAWCTSVTFPSLLN